MNSWQRLHDWLKENPHRSLRGIGSGLLAMEEYVPEVKDKKYVVLHLDSGPTRLTAEELDELMAARIEANARQLEQFTAEQHAAFKA